MIIHWKCWRARAKAKALSRHYKGLVYAKYEAATVGLYRNGKRIR